MADQKWEQKMKTILITVDDIIHIVHRVGLDNLMDEMIVHLRQGLLYFDRTRSEIPRRRGFQYDRPDTGLLEWMPILDRHQKATIKMVGYHPVNPAKRNLPTIMSSISVFDTTNGHLAALADGSFLTALRTGAASAVASSIMGHPESGIVGLIGCGAQAVSQLHALSRVFKIEQVLLYDIDPLASLSFTQRTGFLGLDTRPSALKELVAHSDIICTATSVEPGQGPVFKESKVKPWLHINAVGSDFPGKTEIPASLLGRSFVFPDFLDQAVVEGECQQLEPEQIGPSMPHIVQHPERYTTYRNGLSVFDSTGWALQDQLAMEILMKHAAELGLGTKVQIECPSQDPKNPYGFLNIRSDAATSRTNRDQRRKLKVG